MKRARGAFRGLFAARNLAMFELQYYTGRRISEILAIQVKDVLGHDSKVMDQIYFKRQHLKGKREGHYMQLMAPAIKALDNWIREMWDFDMVLKTHYVFRSYQGPGRPISRRMALKIYKDVFNRAKIFGKVGTHSMRKTFGTRMQDQTGKIQLTAKAMGHASVNSTMHYLESNEQEIIEAMEKAL